jgi:23S rRNA (cytosine1962-C5)-methyltransferase
MCEFDYELLDFGGGNRFERLGRYIIERPSFAAVGVCCSDNELRRVVDSSFVPDLSGGQRGTWTVEIAPWQIQLGQICLELRCTPFGHVGFFAEHVSNWRELFETISAVFCERDVIRVLNLFAYTGGATIAAAKTASCTKTKNIALMPTNNPMLSNSSELSNNSVLSSSTLTENNCKRVEVVHVDSAGNIVNWARRNVEISGVSGVRFIVEDVRKFVVRELRRGNFYDVVILDPPTYGHGARGESWQFAADLPKLVFDIIGLLSDHPVLIIFTAHTDGFDPDALSAILLHAGLPSCLKIKKFQMQIKTKAGKSLPSGYGVTASIYNL